MVDTVKLKSRLRKCGYTQEIAAGKMGINPATFNRKINNVEGETLTVKEVEMLSSILEIPKCALSEYFFAEKLAYTQEDKEVV